MMAVARVCVGALALLVIAAPAVAQTGSTGAIRGVVTDPSGAVVPGAEVRVTAATGETRSTRTQEDGSYVLPLLPPGDYTVEVLMSGFGPARREGVSVVVTETVVLPIRLEVGGVTDVVQVASRGEIVQTQSSALGRFFDDLVVQSLPLVTRNLTQIIGLSPGITTSLADAGEIGRGSGNTSAAGTSAHGNRAYDNNFQLNGVGVNDIFQQGSTSGGVPVPNPDTIQEFKVQTGQFDAAFGRNAGAAVIRFR